MLELGVSFLVVLASRNLQLGGGGGSALTMLLNLQIALALAAGLRCRP